MTHERNTKPATAARQIYDKSVHPDQAERACAATGVYGANLAKVLGISFVTLRDWIKRFPEFGQAVQRGLDQFRTEVAEVALFKRIKGFTYNEVHYVFEEAPGEPAGTKVKVKKKEVKKQVLPDTNAAIAWLRARSPERWAQLGEDPGDDLKRTIKDILADIGQANAGAAPPSGASLADSANVSPQTEGVH